MLRRDFLVYEHWRPDTGLPFYVGKGTIKRARALDGRNRHHKNIRAKLNRQGLEVEIRIVFSGLNEEMAFTLEKSAISYWRSRNVKLINRTLGGEGATGYSPTSVQRATHARANKETWSRPEIKAQRSSILKKAYQDPNLRRKVSDAVKKARATPEARARMREASLISQAKPEVKARQRAGVLAWWKRRKQYLLTVTTERRN